MQDIHRRTQGEYEPVADFLTCMLSMFDRLSPRLPEYEEINFVHRNLLPRFHLTIPRSSIRNFAQFEQIAVATEKSFRVVRAYRPPPRPEGSLLPDLAYRSPTGKIHSRRRDNLNLIEEDESEEANTEEVNTEDLLMISQSPNIKSSRSKDENNQQNKIKTVVRNEPTSGNIPQSKESKRYTEITCWNCDEIGHRHNDCKKDKIIFCYGCGQKGVTKPKCPKCAGKANQGR